ncbi:arylsulfatase B-like [Malaya genurostris]|uniref:arylsulfatase B-like n=1 Tax=Malaya genurostris TaxID=325434 RepID=UPI0026F3DFDA|nr:arylsulfatase B-like [Malaya genurostris]
MTFKMNNLKLCFFFVFSVLGEELKKASQPNIIIIVTDDLGWNDVSFHGSSQILTPNIDALAYNGIILNRHYTPPLCTPSRASLMTGKHPINIGMQHHVIESDQPWGLGLDQKLMPEYFREAGYKTHLVGKWHLGFFRKAYTPTQRGFDSHFGYVGPYIDYWDHSLRMSNTSTRGLDMRRDLDVDYSGNGSYATDLFNNEAIRIIKEHYKKSPLFLVLTHLAPHTGNEDDPMQAHIEDVDRFSYIKDIKRRVLAAMISKVDEGFGNIVRTLKQCNMLDNSIILFYSDNGAPSLGIHSNSGSNYPLRGQKYSPWEGAVRTVAFVWSPHLELVGRVSDQWIHVSDWLPTLAHAAGIGGIPIGSEVDGKDQWNALRNTSLSVRNIVMNNIDRIYYYSSYIKNGWKYVNGTSWSGKYDHWLGQIDTKDELSEAEYWGKLSSSIVAKILSLDIKQADAMRHAATVICDTYSNASICDPQKSPCLFDLINDPCEQNNLAASYPEIESDLRQDVQRYMEIATEPRNKPGDNRSDPIHYNTTWTWWLDELDHADNTTHSVTVLVVVLVVVCISTILVIFWLFMLTSKVMR